MAGSTGSSRYFSLRDVSPDSRPFDTPTVDNFVESSEMRSLPSPSPDRTHRRSPVRKPIRHAPPPPLGLAIDSVPASPAFASTVRRGGSTKMYSPVPGQTFNDSPRPHTGRSTRRSSMSTIHSQFSPYKSVDVDTQALVDRRAGEIAQWNIHWYTPAMIIVLFFAGVCGAIGHHLFYRHLHGQPAKDQLLMVRYGTALAFFTKATLVGTVVLCYRQRIWHSFRQKAMTLKAIDGLFSATEDPTSFKIWEMVWNAKLATLMALCSWLIPIASVLSPASLTSQMMKSVEMATCDQVGSLDFGRESSYDYRNKKYLPGSSLVFYNTTDKNATTPGWFDYYDQPSKNAKRLTITSAYLRKPAQYSKAAYQACGEGWNCTYSINFQGPGYKCEEMASGKEPNLARLTALGVPFNISSLAPEGNLVYVADVDRGQYANPQLEEPIQGPPFPETLGVFQAEPQLWIGYSINTSQQYDPSSPYYGLLKNVHEPKIFRCIAHHTNYTFQIDHRDGVQTTKRKQCDFLKPVVDTNITVDSSTPTGTGFYPVTNWIRPDTDKGTYKLTAAYHVMGHLLRNFLRGRIEVEPVMPITFSDLSETRLAHARTAYPVPDLMDQVQSFFEEMILTMLSEPNLVIAANVSVPCKRSRSANVYVYQAEGLWVGYAIVVSLTLTFMLVGTYSIWQNGVASDTQFSRIMVTTRNPTLDRLSVGACLGGDPFPPDLMKAKLRFGVLLEDQPREGLFGHVEHCTFGTQGEVKDIVKFGTYAGLRRYREERYDQEQVGLLSSEKLPD